MNKKYLSAALATLLICSIGLSSCIGSFRLTGSVMKWNNQVGSKFLNEIVFFAFWILPVYEVTALSDILVINAIEFWSGRSPILASEKTIDTGNDTYIIRADSRGYTIISQTTGQETRLDFIEETQTWALNLDGEMHPFLTFGDNGTVKVIAPAGDFRTLQLTEEDVMAYRADVMGVAPQAAIAYSL